MFWRVAGLATTSPVDLILDRDSYTLEELLNEDDLIQECKSLNQRLVQFLRGKQQVIQLLRYVIEEPAEDANRDRIFKYPFVSCEVFTCEIDQIFNTLIDEREVMDLLFSFLNPDKPHSNLLAGYFSKVVICLLVRRTPDMMNYLQAHRDILPKLVNLIGITSVMEVLMKLVGADDQILMYHSDCLLWLADTNLLEMLVDRLSPKYSADEHTNAAETLSAVARTAPSALASQLSSPEYIGHLFNHVLEAPDSKTGVIHSLSVCITLLDPKRAASAAAAGAARGVNNQIVQPANPETVEGVLQRLGDLLALMDLSGDETTLPTTYGQLQPPLGIHRLKIVEFIAVLLRTNSEGARQELMRLGAISTVLDLFFRYPFNNMLHHHVENIVNSCIDSKNAALLDHLLRDCNLVQRLLDADNDPAAPDTRPEPRAEARRAPSRCGYMGHVTRIANKLIHAAYHNLQIEAYLQGNERWVPWQATVLQKRNQVENVFQWACGRPAALDDRPGDSDDDDFGRDRDFDISTVNLTNNLPREYHRYGMFDADEVIDIEGQAKDDLTENYEGPVRAVTSLGLSDDWEDSDEEEKGGERSPSTSGPGAGTAGAQNMDSSPPSGPPESPPGRASDALSTGTGEGSPSKDDWFVFQSAQSPQTITISSPITPSTHEIIFDDDEDMDTASSSSSPQLGRLDTPEGSMSPNVSPMADDMVDDDDKSRPTFSFNVLKKYLNSPDAPEPIDLFAGKLDGSPKPSTAGQRDPAGDRMAAAGQETAASLEPTFVGEPVFKLADLEDDDDFDVRGPSRPQGGGASASVSAEATAVASPAAEAPVETLLFFNGSGSTPERGSPSPSASGAAPDFFSNAPAVDLFSTKAVPSELPLVIVVEAKVGPHIWPNGPTHGELRQDTPRPRPDLWQLPPGQPGGSRVSQEEVPGVASFSEPSASQVDAGLGHADGVGEKPGAGTGAEQGEGRKAVVPSQVTEVSPKGEEVMETPKAGDGGGPEVKTEAASKGLPEGTQEAGGSGAGANAESAGHEVPSATADSEKPTINGLSDRSPSIDGGPADEFGDNDPRGRQGPPQQGDSVPSLEGKGGGSVQRMDALEVS